MLQYELEGKSVKCLARFSSEGFNPRSNDHVRQRLIELGHNLEEIATKTESGKLSVNAELLRTLAWQGCEFSKDLLEYRRYSKILSTYVLPFIEGSEGDGRLHGSFNQSGSEDLYGDGKRGTNTGRLSSSNPNLQNIPSRTEDGKKVRKAFIATPGWHMFDGDKKQIEPRLVGHFSQSPKLIKAYAQGLDTHTMFAEDIFGRSHDVHKPGQLDTGSVEQGSTRGVTPVERFIGKTSWLATVYGCSYKKLLYICEQFNGKPLELELGPFYKEFDSLGSKDRNRLFSQAGEDREVVAKWLFFKNVQDKFIAANPEIWNWRTWHINRTKRLGYIVTIGGRRIRIDGLDSKDFAVRMTAEREAVNYLVQGSAADALKLVVLKFNEKILRPGKGHLFALVHDEILGDLKNPEDLSVVKDCMENTLKLRNIPMEADVRLVENWSQK